MKRILTIIIAALVACTFAADAKRMSDLKIYINPGHGGYTANDRNIPIYPYALHDTLGYWESKSNLYKGLHMYHILDSLGATPMLSRVKNRTEDNRALSSIAAEANAFGADFFLSIHSNAGENVNYPLMLYRENEIGIPRYPENITLSEIVGKNLYSNKLPIWTHKLQVCGDLTFYQNMWQGGLGVLRTLYVRGLLSEGGMHEHRPEAYRLMNDDYWWLEAWHFCRAIMEFFDTEDRFVTGNVAGIVYDDNNLREKDMPVAFHYFGRDMYAPVNGCLVELLDLEGNVVQKRTTDNIYNGVFVFRNVAPGKYRLRTTHSEYYQTEADVEVTANEVTYNDLPLSMVREFPLAITEYVPVVAAGEDVSCATTVELEFNSDLDIDAFENAFTITPAVEGFYTYTKNRHRAIFTPNTAFERGTHYTVNLANTACHPDKRYENRFLEAPFTFEFDTRNRNRLEMLSHFPADGGEVHFKAPTIEIRFDNKIESFYDHFTITDASGKQIGVNKTKSKSNQLTNGYGNLVASLSQDFEPGQTYNVVLSGNLRDKEQLPMGEDLKFSFKAIDATTERADHTVYDDFEDEAPFAYSADDSKGISNALPTCARSTTEKMSGKSAARFTYAFADNREGEAVWNYNGTKPLALNAGDEIGMYVFGDFNDHELYVGVTSGTDTKWVKVADMNFRGWRHITVSLDGFDESFTYLLKGFRLVQTPSVITQKGTFYIDALTSKATSGVNDATVDAAADLKVLSDRILFGTAGFTAIYDLSGAEVACSQGSAISTAMLAPGIYMVRHNGHTTKFVKK